MKGAETQKEEEAEEKFSETLMTIKKVLVNLKNLPKEKYVEKGGVDFCCGTEKSLMVPVTLVSLHVCGQLFFLV